MVTRDNQRRQYADGRYTRELKPDHRSGSGATGSQLFGQHYARHTSKPTIYGANRQSNLGGGLHSLHGSRATDFGQALGLARGSNSSTVDRYSRLDPRAYRDLHNCLPVGGGWEARDPMVKGNQSQLQTIEPPLNLEMFFHPFLVGPTILFFVFYFVFFFFVLLSYTPSDPWAFGPFASSAWRGGSMFLCIDTTQVQARPETPKPMA